MSKIVLIDGHSILNRAFYGVPMLTNSKGLHTNAIFGFLNILFKILDEEQPEYLTVTFDVSAPVKLILQKRLRAPLRFPTFHLYPRIRAL